MAITLTDNDFFSGLSNLALFMKVHATNTSEKVQSFVDSFATETLSNGDQKIFPYSDLPGVTDYAAKSSLLTVTKVNAGEESLKITEKKVVKTSWSAQILNGAFTSESGMNMFVGYILGQMESAKYAYLYDDIITQLYSKVLAGARQNRLVELIDLTAATTPSDMNDGAIINQKRIAKAIQQDIQNIQVYNTQYNGKGIKEALALQDLRLVVSADYDNDLVIDLMAELLNSKEIANSYAKPEKLTIPEISIAEEHKDVVGWIMHKAAFQWFYMFTFMGTFFDQSNLINNSFMHFWYGRGFLDFLPIVQIKTKVAGAGA